MNKLQWIEIVQNKLGGGSATVDIKEKYRDGVVRIHCGIVFDDLIVRVFQNSSNTSLSDLDSYSKWFTALSINGVSDAMFMKSVPVPTQSGKLLQIPNNKAIRKITTLDPEPIASRTCLYRDLAMDEVYSQLEVNTYISVPRYYVIGGKIYFDSRINTALGVNILMIVPFSEWDDTEELPAPLENNATIIEEVCQRLLNMPPEDKIIDDNAVQV